MTSTHPSHRPRWLWLGIGLVAVFWWLDWQRAAAGIAPPWGFFGLWLGYILTVDGFTCARSGTSPLARGVRGWLGLFLASLPAWWLFEFLNIFLKNWIYLGVETYAGPSYGFWSSLSFSTVTPAVLTTAELIGSSMWLRRIGRPLAKGPRWPISNRALAAWIVLGLAMLGSVLAWPDRAFPLAWLGVIFVLDPVNHLVGWPSLAAHVGRGDWRPVALLAGAALVCGYFWEMWNYHSYPKWVYDIPHVCAQQSGPCPFPKLFEMPWLGYGGYLPFGCEVYVLYVYAAGLAGSCKGRSRYFFPPSTL